jgi:3-hydroxyisobutyrate dehydrogenase-like beta-hydroxyacid dehydrogenase
MREGTSIDNEREAGRVTVVGTGAIGSAVSRRLLSAGREVVVWNRTANRTTDLVAAGAVAAQSLKAAVMASELTLVTLKTYEAVQDVIDQLDGDLSGRTIVVLCTGSPSDARLACERVKQLGAHYIDGGVQTSPEDIGTDVATILYSGSEAGFERHRPTLGLLSAPRFVGTSPQAAAVWDITLFGVWYDAQLGLLRALEGAMAAGIDIGQFVETAGIQLGHVVDAASGTAAELQDSDYPRGPADLSEHLVVVRQLIEMRAASRLGDGGLSHAADVIEALIRKGRGAEGLTATAGREPGPKQEGPDHP